MIDDEHEVAGWNSDDARTLGFVYTGSSSMRVRRIQLLTRYSNSLYQTFQSDKLPLLASVTYGKDVPATVLTELNFTGIVGMTAPPTRRLLAIGCATIDTNIVLTPNSAITIKMPYGIDMNDVSVPNVYYYINISLYGKYL